MDDQTNRPRSLPPSLVPGLRPDTTLGEIAQKIGRKLAQEQDTVMHKFAEAHPEVIIDDIALCHGHVKGADHSTSYRIWVEIRTPEEKAQRDLHRHYQLVEPDLLKLARRLAGYLDSTIAGLSVESRQRDLPEDEWSTLMMFRDELDDLLAKIRVARMGDQAAPAAASGSPAPRSG
jgi:hypothetical protein